MNSQQIFGTARDRVATVAPAARLPAPGPRLPGADRRWSRTPVTLRRAPAAYGDGFLTERVQRIARAFGQSGVHHQVTTDIRRVLWDKSLFITGIGGVTALARSGIGPLIASAAGRSLLRAACAEIVAVAQAEGAHLQPAAIDAVLTQAAALPAPWRSSMAGAR